MKESKTERKNEREGGRRTETETGIERKGKGKLKIDDFIFAGDLTVDGSRSHTSAVHTAGHRHQIVPVLWLQLLGRIGRG